MLGSYATSFPPESSRTGTFTPIKSYWSLLKEKLHLSASSTNASKPLLFPPDSQLAKSAPTSLQGLKAPPVFRPHVPGTFTPDPYYSDSDSDLGEGEKVLHRPAGGRKWTASTNHSDTTLVNARPEQLQRQRGVGRAFQHSPVFIVSPASSYIEYGDKDAERSPELNLGLHRIEPSKDDDRDWKPVFLKRSESIKSAKAEIVSGLEEDDSRDVTSTVLSLSSQPSHYSTPRTALQDHSGARTPIYAYSGASLSTPGLVPATPSLIKALDRVSKAQRLAYSGEMTTGFICNVSREPALRRHDNAPQHSREGDSCSRDQGDERRWKGFWADVQRKAAEP
jgi:hypothetical protein